MSALRRKRDREGDDVLSPLHPSNSASDGYVSCRSSSAIGATTSSPSTTWPSFAFSRSPAGPGSSEPVNENGPEPFGKRQQFRKPGFLTAPSAHQPVFQDFTGMGYADVWKAKMENRQLLAEKDAEIERLQGALAAGSGNAELDRLRQENTVLKRGMRIQWQQNKKLEDEVQSAREHIQRMEQEHAALQGYTHQLLQQLRQAGEGRDSDDLPMEGGDEEDGGGGYGGGALGPGFGGCPPGPAVH